MICEKCGLNHKFDDTECSIIITNKDLKGRAYEANKILNFYFKKAIKQPKLLPENSLNRGEISSNRINYYYHINEILYYNCQLLNIKYPLYAHHISFALDTKEKVYRPIIGYFESLNNSNSS